MPSWRTYPVRHGVFFGQANCGNDELGLWRGRHCDLWFFSSKNRINARISPYSTIPPELYDCSLFLQAIFRSCPTHPLIITTRWPIIRVKRFKSRNRTLSESNSYDHLSHGCQPPVRLWFTTWFHHLVHNHGSPTHTTGAAQLSTISAIGSAYSKNKKVKGGSLLLLSRSQFKLNSHHLWHSYYKLCYHWAEYKQEHESTVQLKSVVLQLWLICSDNRSLMACPLSITENVDRYTSTVHFQIGDPRFHDPVTLLYIISLDVRRIRQW